MAREMSSEDLAKYSQEHQGQYDIHKGATKLFGWRCFLLDEPELKRLAMLEDNVSMHASFYPKHIRLVSRLTGISSEVIESTGLQGKILTVIPQQDS